MSAIDPAVFWKEVESSLAYEIEGAKLDFSLALKRVMDQKGMNKARLADVLKVSRPMVSKLLSGEANLTIETMVRYAYSLDSRIFIKIGRKDDVAHVFRIMKNVERIRTSERVPVPRAVKATSWRQPNNGVIEHEAQPVAA